MTMENEYLQKLKKVASAFTADDSGDIFFSKQIIFKAQSGQKKEKLTSYLAGFIYSNCYCRNNTDAIFQNKIKPGEYEDHEFIGQLAEANTATDNHSEKWQIMFRMPNDYVMLGKGADNFSIHQSATIAETATPVDTGPAYATIKNPKEHSDEGSSFYYIFSDNPESRRSGSLLRFYWNIEPAGVPILIKRLTSGFNSHFVPFQFKCLKHPGLYSRHDAGVLYIFPKYVHIACNIIQQFMDEVKPFLNEDVPMFTLKLCNGLAFAESPAGGQSFGMQHAQILSEALITSFENRMNEEQKLIHITETYRSIGYDLTCLYKNPESINNYSFLKQKIN